MKRTQTNNADKAPETASKPMLHYNSAYRLSELVARLGLVPWTLEEADKLMAVQKTIGEAIQEHQGRLKEAFDKHKIDKLEESHPQFKEISKELDQLFVQASSIEVESLQVFTGEEIIKMSNDARVPLVFDEIAVVLTAMRTN